jgi:hypothetical protein
LPRSKRGSRYTPSLLKIQLFYQDVDFENPPISQFLAETSVQRAQRVKRVQLDHWEIGMLFGMFESYDPTKKK